VVRAGALAAVHWRRKDAPAMYGTPLVIHVAPGTELRLELRPTYLYAHVEGPTDSMAISVAYWSAIARECRTHGFTRLLVVENLRKAATSFETFEIVDALVGMGFRDIRIAFVDLLVEEQPMMEYAEFLAHERGIEGRVFGTVEKAEAWIAAD
jgi:hypothetical protein